jgi:DUF4097 and DUF4098 domain-containing protein YvlB
MRLVLTSLLLLSSSFALANDCAFTAERSLDIDPAGLAALRFELGASDLDVQGVPGLAKIEVRGKACASEQDWLNELNVEQARQGDRVVVRPAPHAHSGGWGNQYAYIDFSVRVPAGLALDVDSGSGDTKAGNVGAFEFKSGSGDLDLDHAGAVGVKVGSGDVIAHHLASFTLHSAGSGDMKIDTVQGDVKVDHVGSGDLQFADIKGSVRIDSIGSGDLNAERIGGDLVVGSIGSGDVTAKSVTGNLIVKAAGSGDIVHSGIGGTVEVPKRHEND